jgi:hypothetical protein
MSPGQDSLTLPVIVPGWPFNVPTLPSMVGLVQTRSPLSTLRASTRPTMPNSLPDTPVTINGPCAFEGTIRGAAVAV